ncbi:hypothetical protein T484DRAFT_2918016 [Baffinella frigidus]|nr:hypothetical protein T484DRAFT_2918016 [Cryptophyta sp. CCMP2293]
MGKKESGESKRVSLRRARWVLGCNALLFSSLAAMFAGAASLFLVGSTALTTVALLGLYVLAAFPPPSVLAFAVGSAAWGMHTTGVMQGLVFACLASCGLMCSIQIALQVTGMASSVKLPAWLGWVAGYIGHLVRVPSVVCMNWFWICPPMLCAMPRLAAAIALEALAVLLFGVISPFLPAERKVSTEKADGDVLPVTEPSRSQSLTTFGGDDFPDACPILLVSGLNRGSAHWLFARLCFSARPELFGPVVVFEGGGAEAGLDDVAKALGEAVEAALVHKTSSRVILIGHSVGGLVCAHYSDNFAAERGVSVEAVVCLACPWMGLPGLPRPVKVHEAHLSLLQNISANMRADLEEGSVGLRRIKENRLRPLQDSRNRPTRYYNVVGGCDLLVRNGRLIAQRHAFWFLLLPHVGHHSILLSQTLWGQVFVWLANLQDQRPKPEPVKRLRSASNGSNGSHPPLPGGPFPGIIDSNGSNCANGSNDGASKVRGLPRNGSPRGAAEDV